MRSHVAEPVRVIAQLDKFPQPCRSRFESCEELPDLSIEFNAALDVGAEIPGRVLTGCARFPVLAWFAGLKRVGRFDPKSLGDRRGSQRSIADQAEARSRSHARSLSLT